MDKKSRTVLFSISSNAVLLTVKLVAGVLTGSVSVLSEAVHSATDLVASVIALVAVQRSNSPPDEDHNYGHGRFENLAGVFEGLVLFVVGGYIVYGAVDNILNGAELELLGLGIVVMALSAVVNLFVSEWLLRVARETDSRALEAEGYNLRTDVWGAAGVAVGLIGALVTGWTVLDPIIAALIGLAILWTAFRLVSRSTRVLLDESLPPDELDMVERVIEDCVRSEAAIRGFHKLRARKSGSQRHIDFHLQLKAQTTLGEAHKISDDLEERIRRGLPNSDVLIHLEDDRSFVDGTTL
ncbi:MAG: Cobalt-zinc-cadmium resistance protein [uncultured Rubrobacteraceae bacterium]|uniref:Cobalt-zinc-cadmium resistance protein n=1 Tax=uncultured Rubrobacteraceae bacterium TaxID=349277 RepID=A0A6J4R3A1_9ACTN|nr:MAG: Cobalt-zinc-cadmium resistance protein [uncultured Rubrobacteraceae bacterium]